MPKKENDLSLGQQMKLAGIVVARSYRGPEPSFEERQLALDQLFACSFLHTQVLEMVSRQAPFGEHRQRALARLASPPVMASAGSR